MAVGTRAAENQDCLYHKKKSIKHNGNVKLSFIDISRACYCIQLMVNVMDIKVVVTNCIIESKIS